jgi:hypothetical protein
MLKCQQHVLANKLSRDRVEWHLTHIDLNVLAHYMHLAHA